jgi:hypothetical protein
MNLCNLLETPNTGFAQRVLPLYMSLYEDNTACTKWENNSIGGRGRAKHIDVSKQMRVEKLHLDRAITASSAHELTVHCQRCLQALRRDQPAGPCPGARNQPPGPCWPAEQPLRLAKVGPQEGMLLPSLSSRRSSAPGVPQSGGPKARLESQRS